MYQELPDFYELYENYWYNVNHLNAPRFTLIGYDTATAVGKTQLTVRETFPVTRAVGTKGLKKMQLTAKQTFHFGPSLLSIQYTR